MLWAIIQSQAQLLGYQHMPETELLLAQEVELTFSLEELLSRPGCQVICRVCGEEIINKREVFRDGLRLCRACADQSYYRPPIWAAQLDVTLTV